MPHAIMGQCIYPFEALDDDYGSKLHSVSQSTERAGELRNVSIHGQGGKAAACKSGRSGGRRARSLPPSFLKEERDSTVFVASLRGLAWGAYIKDVCTRRGEGVAQKQTY